VSGEQSWHGAGSCGEGRKLKNEKLAKMTTKPAPNPGTFHFFIIFDDVVEYLSIRCAQLKKQGRRTKPILTVG
jgi:hypothetical protein